MHVPPVVYVPANVDPLKSNVLAVILVISHWPVAFGTPPTVSTFTLSAFSYPCAVTVSRIHDGLSGDTIAPVTCKSLVTVPPLVYSPSNTEFCRSIWVASIFVAVQVPVEFGTPPTPRTITGSPVANG